MSEAEPPAPRPSLLALGRQFAEEVRALFGAEVALASAEIRFNLGRLALAFAIILAGGLVLGIAGIALLAALMAAMAPALGPVGSALVTALAALIAGLGLIGAGVRALRRQPLAPHRALSHVRATAASLKATEPDDTETRDGH